MPGFAGGEATSIYGASIFPEHVPRHQRHEHRRDVPPPARPRHTTVVAEYLFRPEVVEAPGFDPTEIVEFTELVANQDYTVCERVQQGVRSRAFTHGVYAEKDELPLRFNQRYLVARDGRGQR